jgi:hypothetical protein
MSDHAYDIVNALYNDDKVSALETINNAMHNLSIEAINDKRVEMAQSWFAPNTEEEEE